MIRKGDFKIKNTLSDFFELSEQPLPDWLETNVVKENLTLKSYLWKSENCLKIRLCEFNIKNKFSAESLVIYPDYHLNCDIFGTEYITISNKKYFGVIDFHPISNNKTHLNYLKMFPDAKVEKLKFYNISKFFSKKLWYKKDNSDFYDEYLIWLKCYLHQYKKYLNDSDFTLKSNIKKYQKYNHYMSNKDPAFGILKSYFGKEFAEKYIHDFLFN